MNITSNEFWAWCPSLDEIQPAPDGCSLSEVEIENLILRTLEGSGGQATTSQLEMAVRWGHNARLYAHLLDAVLAGEIALDMRGGSPTFGAAK